MKKEKKTIKEFCEWLEKEERQNWEIERYVEDLLSQQKEEIKEMIKKKLLDVVIGEIYSVFGLQQIKIDEEALSNLLKEIEKL